MTSLLDSEVNGMLLSHVDDLLAGDILGGFVHWVFCMLFSFLAVSHGSFSVDSLPQFHLQMKAFKAFYVLPIIRSYISRILLITSQLNSEENSWIASVGKLGYWFWVSFRIYRFRMLIILLISWFSTYASIYSIVNPKKTPIHRVFYISIGVFFPCSYVLLIPRGTSF